MVLFQPAPATVWDFGYYYGLGYPFQIIFWIVAAIAIIFALFLLASYLNTRKPAHFYWGLSFACMWIITHLAIFDTSFSKFLEAVPSTLSALMVGLFAVGLFKNVKPEKEKMGNYLLYYVIIMSLVIGFFKGAYEYAVDKGAGTFLIPVEVLSRIVPIVVMALHIPSAFLIVYLPITTRAENGKPALMLTLAGILMTLVGVVLALATLVGTALPFFTGDDFLYIVFNAFPYLYLFAGICFAWGTFIPKKWNFAIAGIELE